MKKRRKVQENCTQKQKLRKRSFKSLNPNNPLFGQNIRHTIRRVTHVTKCRLYKNQQGLNLIEVESRDKMTSPQNQMQSMREHTDSLVVRHFALTRLSHPSICSGFDLWLVPPLLYMLVVFSLVFIDIFLFTCLCWV